MSISIQPISPRYNRDLLLSSPTPPDFLLFWGHTPARDGSITQSCLSQWWMADFTFQGDRYCCMEQCMMAGKARLFGDAEMLEKIMASSDPRTIKKLGRQVRGFDQAIWETYKYALVMQGNVCKFAQNPALKQFLLSTGDKILVEASPYDRIWGIGLSAADPRAQDPRQWRGRNLLGFALTEVRDILRQSVQPSDAMP